MILYFGVSVSENQVKHTKNVYGYKKKNLTETQYSTDTRKPMATSTKSPGSALNCLLSQYGTFTLGNAVSCRWGGGTAMRPFFKLYIIINRNKMKTGKKTCCVVYKVHFVVCEHMYKYIHIHTNAESYTAQHTLLVYMAMVSLLGNSQEILAFVPVEGLTLCAQTVLCLPQSEIKPFLLS